MSSVVLLGRESCHSFFFFPTLLFLELGCDIPVSELQSFAVSITYLLWKASGTFGN